MKALFSYFLQKFYINLADYQISSTQVTSNFTQIYPSGEKSELRQLQTLVPTPPPVSPDPQQPVQKVLDKVRDCGITGYY